MYLQYTLTTDLHLIDEIQCPVNAFIYADYMVLFHSLGRSIEDSNNNSKKAIIMNYEYANANGQSVATNS